MATLQHGVAKMTDTFSQHASSLTAPIVSGYPIIPHNDQLLSIVTRAIYVGGGGNLHVQFADGLSVTLTNVIGGTILPLRVVRVYADTTAIDIVGLY